MDETRDRIQQLCSRDPSKDVGRSRREGGAADTTADPIKSKRVELAEKVNGFLSYLGFGKSVESHPAKRSVFKGSRGGSDERAPKVSSGCLTSLDMRLGGRA